MTFTKLRSPVVFFYNLDNTSLLHSDSWVLDLGFMLSSRLGPGSHIEYICCKVYWTLGFILRLYRDLRLSLSIKLLYYALVRPILEYGAVIWNPHSASHSLMLERVQRTFLRYASYKLGIIYPAYNYEPVATQLGLVSLPERRRTAGITSTFLVSLLQGNIDCPFLLSLISFRVLQRFPVLLFFSTFLLQPLII